jgi:hypothetical protein
MRDINQISAQIIDAAMKVHSALGQGCWKWPTKVVCCMREPSAPSAVKPATFAVNMAGDKHWRQ